MCPKRDVGCLGAQPTAAPKSLPSSLPGTESQLQWSHAETFYFWPLFKISILVWHSQTVDNTLQQLLHRSCVIRLWASVKLMQFNRFNWCLWTARRTPVKLIWIANDHKTFLVNHIVSWGTKPNSETQKGVSIFFSILLAIPSYSITRTTRITLGTISAVSD